MISKAEIYNIFTAIVPLYVAMILAYAAVKWWNLFTPEQCSGVNKFVAKFSIPLLAFQVIAQNNLYNMNTKLMLADFLQKLFALLLLIAVVKLSSRCSWPSVVTGFSVSTLPNTLIVGIPMLGAMYGDESGQLLAQIVVLQSLVWNNVLLFLFEIDAAKRPSEIVPSAEDIAPQVKEAARQPKTALLIFFTVGKKLIANPNTHAALLGLIWSAIQFRCNIKFPAIVENSITILANGGLGMSMFSLGLFMASQPSLMPCGVQITALAMVLKFMAGPALMAAASVALGIRGKLLRVAIVQAALPPGVVPFVFAKEYNVHPDTLSTGVIFACLLLYL